MNEAALLEEVKPLLDRMAKATGEEYCLIRLQFDRRRNGETALSASAYVHGFDFHEAGTVAEAVDYYTADKAEVWSTRADKAEALAKTMRLDYEKQLRTANELRSKALATQPAIEGLPAIPSDKMTVHGEGK